MLKSLRLRPIAVDYRGFVPPLVQPLLRAAAAGEDLAPIVDSITKGFGFEVINFAVNMTLRADRDPLVYVFTTMPAEWVAIYDERSYIEVDPRVQALLHVPLPMIWDQESLGGKSAKVDEFLAAGRRYGLGSGIAVGFVDLKSHAVFLALSSSVEKLNPQRKAEIESSLGDIMLFVHFFHEVIAAGIIEQSMPSQSQGAPLSPRERECLAMAARGLTSEDIAHKLGITPRTVQFHFGSIRSKLAAATRQEAIAKAVQAGLIGNAR